MAGNVPALEAGFDYQWLYGWYRILDLVNPAGSSGSVTIENPEAGLFDDVTISPRLTGGQPAEFIQVKFHVGTNGWYTAASLISNKLIRKAWKTFDLLRADYESIQLSLVTTWAWDPDDSVRIEDLRLTRAFIEGTAAGKAAEERAEWKTDAGDPPEPDFQAFLQVLRFRTAYDEKTELKERMRERLFYLGLKSDEGAIRKGVGQVRDWVIDRKGRITAEDVNDVIDHLELRLPDPEPPSVTLYVHTVRLIPTETGGDFELDWRDAFEGTNRERGHALLDPADWNGRLLPELEAKAAEIEDATSARLLRVRGLARLSPWFAVGFTFRETTGWSIETDLRGKRWRTDAPQGDDEIEPTVVDLPGPAEIAALSIGVTGDPTPRVRAYLESAGNPAGRLAVVRCPRSGMESIRDAGDVTRLADVVKTALQSLEPRARRVLLFYWGPAAGAVFIGHRLNAVAREIQLHEEDNGEYTPSILLKS